MQFTEKAGKHSRDGGGMDGLSLAGLPSIIPEKKTLMDGVYSLAYQFLDDDDEPYANTPYTATNKQTGEEFKGMTDKDGWSERFRSDSEDEIEVSLRASVTITSNKVEAMSQTSKGATGPSDPFKVLKISRREFTIHFRQPKNMAGRYGFDYPRDADRYPIERVLGKRKPIPLYKGNISNFKDIYLKGAMHSPLLHKYNYLPAWLAIFPIQLIVFIKVAHLCIKMEYN